MTRFSKPIRALLTTVISCISLGACETVEFQSPPSEPLLACDSVWVGDWRAVDLKPKADAGEQLYLRITENCERWYSVSLEADDAGVLQPDVDDLEADLELGFAKTARQEFLSARDRPKSGEGEPSPDDKPNGFALIAYDKDGATINLRQIDLKATAHLIVDGAVPGWVEKRDRRADGSRDAYSGSFWVYVFGNAAETRQLLEQHDLLDKPWMRLEPVAPDTSKQIDAWIKKALTQPDSVSPP